MRTSATTGPSVTKLMDQAERARPAIAQAAKALRCKMQQLVKDGDVTVVFGDGITAADLFDFVVDHTTALDDASESESESETESDDTHDADSDEATSEGTLTPKRPRRR